MTKAETKADRLVSLDEILSGDPDRGVAPLIPVSRSGWHKWVARGVVPRPTKIGKRSFWRESDLRKLMGG